MTITQFNRIVEIRTKIISMGTFLCGSLFAVTVTNNWSWSRFIVMALAVLCVDMGTTGFNSYFDFINGTDKAQYNLERDKVLVHEKVNPKSALVISLSLFALAGVLGILLAWWTSFILLLVGGFCMVVGFLYTGGPYPISRTPFGELFAGSFLGPVLFILSYYIQALTFNVTTLLVAIPLLLLIALILMVNNSCDRIADKIAGRRTLSILLPERTIQIFMRSILIGAFALELIFAFLQIIPLAIVPFSLIGGVLAWKAMRTMEKRGFSLETKGASMENVSQIFILYCASFIAGALISLVL